MRLVPAAVRAVGHLAGGGLEFVRFVYRKAEEDNVAFLSGAIAFNVLVAAPPFLLLLVSIFAFVLPALVDDPQRVAIDYVLSVLPPTRSVVQTTRQIVSELIRDRASFGALALGLFAWTTTRVFGSLRSALREVLDLPTERGIIAGKVFDFAMVVVAGSLFAANTAITVVLEAAHTYGTDWLGLGHGDHGDVTTSLSAQVLAFGFIVLMFLLLYRFLPLRRPPWRFAWVAALFAGTTWEVLKAGFAWYVANLGAYLTTYGVLATLLVLVFWVYYSAFCFILGGEVAFVIWRQRRRRAQRESLV